MPSTIYWRRRAAVLFLLAVVLLLVFWAVRSTGGGGSPTAGSDDGKGPVESITPGPTPSESLIEERPGGREEGDDEDGDGEADSDGGAGSAGGDGEDGSAGEDDGANGEGGGDAGSDEEGAADTSGGQGGASGLPDCAPAEVTLSLRSDANDYAPGQEPELRLTAQNSGSAACGLDFGHQALTMTLADAEDNEVWSSADCPATPATARTAVPAGGTADHTVSWDLRHSVADCDAGRGAAAAPGTYLAEAQLAGYPVAQTSFRLEAD
ncbi:hypothetical protein RM844_25090 [Streptomyces sp. DSM 44915]|uniref:DUF4232 domain-containing protein n=1 Tax=Streptomyces chisholmiae TaxID=3075540 RepID=A0ABU2JXT0_9ACTN|nr:hypothetical protein [Streptomyces sp. DSM 44915]MDT0269563.1 hypothetical protein [Streptomyces sp. DSM 44915]